MVATVTRPKDARAMLRKVERNKAVQCGESRQRTTQTPRTSLRNTACQTEVVPLPGSGLHSKSSHGGTSNRAAQNRPGIQVNFLQTGVCCVACYKFFARKDSADRHWRLQHALTERLSLQVEPYWCPYCQFSSYARKTVQAHERNHNEEEVYTFELSPPKHQSRNEPSRGKTSQAVRVTGRRSQNDKAANTCDICQKEVAHPWYLEVHKQLHTGERPYVCGVCQKRFHVKSGLTAHRKAHEQRHTCACGRRFISKKDLDFHSQVHTMGKRPHVCGVCQEAFVCREKLVLHEKSAHARVVERPYKCITCHEGFPHKMALISHDCKMVWSRMAQTKKKS
ncbi:zinc finger and BTB domain-containing protein 41-like isoform X2 [Haemaphysalis longicornis]